MDILKTVRNYGVDNVYIIDDILPIHNIMGISYTSRNDKAIPVICKITEDRYKLNDNYKIQIKPIEPYNKAFGKQSYYISDFNMMVDKNSIIVLVKPFKQEVFK